jgi:hypothetical protein
MRYEHSKDLILTVQWLEVFLKDRKVCLSFNKVISEERGQPIGVLQGLCHGSAWTPLSAGNKQKHCGLEEARTRILT